jgi:ribosomal protein L11 methyltransferase
MNWILVKAFCHEAPADWSPIIEIYREHGIENTLEEAWCLTGSYADVTGVEAEIEKLKQALLAGGVDEVVVEPLELEDWENAWKKHFKPRRVGKNFVIKPSWESFDTLPTDIVIELDPGQAFGTGDHPTTRMCLEFLEQYIKPGSAVLDLGCGSGILAIGAKRLGAESVLAIDIETVSVQVAKENFARNSVQCDARVGDVLQLNLAQEYDIVVSNIISATLINLAPDAAHVVKPGGLWITSGVIDQNWGDVQDAAQRQGFVTVTSKSEDGWTSAVLQK